MLSGHLFPLLLDAVQVDSNNLHRIQQQRKETESRSGTLWDQGRKRMRGRQYRKSSIKKDSGGERAPRVNAPRARYSELAARPSAADADA